MQNRQNLNLILERESKSAPLKFLSKLVLSFLFSAFFFLVSSSTVKAATYYVDNSCTNNGDGSSQTCATSAGLTGPFNSIANVQAKSGGYLAGDNIYLKKGETFAERLTFTWSGTSGNVITIGAYGIGANPILNPSLDYPLYLSGVSFVTVNGVDVQTTVAASTGVRQTGPNSNIVLQNMNVSANQYAMSASGTVTTENISNSTFSSVLAQGGYSIYFFGTGNSNITISNVNITSGPIRVKNTQNINISSVTATNVGNVTSGVAVIQIDSGSGTLNVNTLTSTNALGGVIAVNSSNYTSGNATVTNITNTSQSAGLAGIYITGSSYIDISNFTINGTAGSGIQVQNASHHITFTDGITENNLNDGMDTTDTVHDITFTRVVAKGNGTKTEASPQASGDGFSTHTSNYNINFYYCLSYNNTNTAFALWDQSAGLIYNSVGYNNGGDWTSAGGFPTVRGGLAVNLSGANPTTGGTFIVKNSIFMNNYPREVYTQNYWLGATTSNNNIYYPLDNNNFYNLSGGFDKSWLMYHATNGYETNSQNINPLFISTTTPDFHLQDLSPAIDAGINVGLTQDYAGNSVRSAPSIGAYEYQPPYTLGTNYPDTSGNVRIYADGKFRNTNNPSGTTANLSITPVGGFGNGDTSSWLDLVINSWGNTKNWTESSSYTNHSTMQTSHTIGNLTPNTSYTVELDGAPYGIYISDSSGNVSFTYTGGYSSHTFNLYKTPDPASAPTCSDTTPTGNTPSLYSANQIKKDSIILNFTNWQSPIDHFALEYGTSSNNYYYAADNIGGSGTTSYTVNYLNPNTTYYFRIRAGNGCAVGSWSNEISGKTLGLVSTNNLNIVNSTLTPSNPPSPKAMEGQAGNTQGYSLTVKVKDTSGNPVEGAEVTIHSNVQTQKTNKDGVATFQNVESGQHQVFIAYNNYKGSESINLTADSQTKAFDLNVTIQKQNVLLSPQVIGIIVLSALAISFTSFKLLQTRKKLKKVV